MPELPEVETVRCALERKLKNKIIRDINVIYPNIFEGQDIVLVKNKICNQMIREIRRRGKWLLFYLDDYVLVSHLRMEGKYFYREFESEISKHDHVIFNISDEFELRYNDVRKFGKMYLVDKDNIDDEVHLKKLGLEPWDEKLDKNYLKEKFSSKKLPIKTVLLDQEIITGIGNIYADEILFLSKISPYVKASLLNDDSLDEIIKQTREVLENAIKKGGTTIRSYTSEEGISGRFQNDLLVHQRANEKCYKCDSLIVKEQIGGRGTYYCPICQK